MSNFLTRCYRNRTESGKPNGLPPPASVQPNCHRSVSGSECGPVIVLRSSSRARLYGPIARVHEENAADAEAGNRFGDGEEERDLSVKRKNIGSTFDSWLREEGLYEKVSATSIKRVVARQVEAAMQQKGLTKVEMARRMRTSRSALDRLLDPENDAITLTTLQKAAAVVGRQVRLELV